MNAAYVPQEQAQGLLSSFSPLVDIINANQRAGVNYGTGLQQTGLQAVVEAEKMASQLVQGRNAALANALVSGINSASTAVDGTGGFLDWLF